MRTAHIGHAHITHVNSYTDTGEGDIIVSMEPGLSDLHDVLLALPSSRYDNIALRHASASFS